VLIVEKRANPPNGVDEVMLLAGGHAGQWLKPIPTTDVRALCFGRPRFLDRPVLLY
jgi:hypothetical protein